MTAHRGQHFRTQLIGLLFVLPLVLRVGLPLAVAQSPDEGVDGRPQFHRDTFDDRDPTWTVAYLPDPEQRSARVIQHRRERGSWNQTGRVEVLRFETTDRNQLVRLEYPLPPARAFDELTLRLRVQSAQDGLQLGLRIVFMDLTDPRTGQPLTADIMGQVYRGRGEWRQVECRADQRAVNRVLQRLRTRLAVPLKGPGRTYVDKAFVLCDLNPGAAQIALDDLEFGPIVPPAETMDVVRSDAQETRTRIDFRLGHLRVNGLPFFPRFTPHHGESVDALRDVGVNAAWIASSGDSELLAALKEAGLWAIATPPPDVPASAGPEASVHDAMRPRMQLPSNSDQVLFWCLGTRISAAAQADLIRWTRRIRGADLLRRPLMADIAGAERVYSRHLDLVGMSRPLLGTTVSLRQYSESLKRKRDTARPGTFSWTWIQAEAPSAHTQRDLGRSNPFVVEPEQLQLQLYAALASGSRAIGYWKTSPLSGDRPGDRERALMLRQLNLELELIEDWLASGDHVGQIPCVIDDGSSSRQASRGESAWETARRSRQPFIRNPLKPAAEPTATNIQAAVIRSDKGQLLLPVWYSETAQFVPGPMVARNISMVVPVIESERAAWLVTTTGIRGLEARRQAGGLRVRLSTADQTTYLDQTAIIVVTSRRDVLAELQQKISRIAEESARTCLELARAKRMRVEAVEAQLSSGDARSSSTFTTVDRLLKSAESSLSRRDFDIARRRAREALQHLRRLQHARWRSAIASLASPASSPHAVCYQTLPDHHRLMNHLSTSSPSRMVPLLPELGASTLDDNGWSRFKGRVPGVAMAAEFVRESRRRQYTLRLTAVPEVRDQPPGIVPEAPVRVTSPILQLRQGEIARVTGRIRTPTPIVGTVDGAMVFDNLLGPAGAIRWRREDDWTDFELIREATADTPLYLTFVLAGLGQLQIADIEVSVFPPRTNPPESLATRQQLLRPATQSRPAADRQ